MNSVEKQLEVSSYVGLITPEFENPKKREILYQNYRILYHVREDGKVAYVSQVQHGSKPITLN